MNIRDGAHVHIKTAHIAIGVNMDGIKHVLGNRIQTSERATFRAGVCAKLANRGVREVLIVCSDGLNGFPEAIHLATRDGSDLCRTPDPPSDAVCELQVPQTCHHGTQGRSTPKLTTTQHAPR